MKDPTILGLIAATLTTISFLPQVIKIIKTKNTTDISLVMYCLLTTGVLLWLIYGYLIQDWPVMIANFITLVFSSVILFMKIKNK